MVGSSIMQVRWSVSALVVSSTLGSGCLYTYGGERTTTRQPLPTETKPRTDALPGRGELAADGTVRFTLDGGKLCARERTSREEIGIAHPKRFSAVGLATVGLSAAGLVGSIYMLTQSGIGSTASESNAGLVIGGVVGVLTFSLVGGFALGLRYGEAAYPASKGYDKLEEHVVHDGTDLLACPQGPTALGALTLTTPWGATVDAAPNLDGVVAFTVDWASERATALSPAQLALPWTVSAAATRTSATWTPSVDEGKRLAQLITQARDRVVVGTTPAQLDAALATGAGGIQIGGSGQLVLTVRNTGGSTATGVTAKTRSSMPALHGLALAFGTLQPGASTTRAVDVQVPDDVLDDAATVLVTVTAASGGTPAELTKKLPLTRAVCPGGKLTRAKYDDKRAKLKRTLAAGDLTQEDFDKFDAELLRCLE